MRERFTPARSCPTLTRICANFRLVRFAASVSSPRGGSFFRPAGFLHCRLIALESGILVQGGRRRVGDPFLIGSLFVVRLAGVRLAEGVNPLPSGVDDDHVLVARLLLAPAENKGLLFRAFRPLAPPLGGVDDQPRRFPGSASGLGKVPGGPLREDSQVVQGRAQDRQQPMGPIIHRGRTQAKEFAQDCLERIGLEVDQKDQELILGLLQSSLAACANSTLSRLAFGGLVCGVVGLIRLGKGSQQTSELRERQARESQKRSPVSLKCVVRDHAFIIFLFPENCLLTTFPSSFSWIAMCVIVVVGVAPCQCFSPGGNQTTSPGRISSIGPPQRCAQPQPAVTIRAWPSGCVCQAVRAPGSKVTLAPETRPGSGASNSGSIRTMPVNQSAGRSPEACEPLLSMYIF